MKAWFVIAATADYGAFVWAETRNGARLVGMDELGYFVDDYFSVKATRYASLDDPEAVEGTIPSETCWDAGCNWMCAECDSFTSLSDGGHVVDGEILCDQCSQVKCPACNGLGYTSDDNDCERCDGDGWIVRPENDVQGVAA